MICVPLGFWCKDASFFVTGLAKEIFEALVCLGCSTAMQRNTS
jgi:hypothetical protein